MEVNEYQYAAEFYRLRDGAYVDQAPIRVDWEPARQWARFTGLRKGLPPPDVLRGETVIEPIWSPTRGEPLVDGFRVTVRRDGSEDVSSDFPTTYFKASARQASAAVTSKGLLEEGDLFRYEIAAFPRATPATPGERSASSFVMRETAAPLPVEASSLATFLESATPRGSVAERDMPVFVPDHVLEETVSLTREAGPKETGGI
jgi:hypothetical protein